MHNIWRILCQKLMSIGAKLTKLWVFERTLLQAGFLYKFTSCELVEQNFEAFFCNLWKKSKKKIFPGLPRETSPLTNAFWVFCFKWFCCELWCTPQNNFFSRRLRRFTVTRSILNILQWKFRQIMFKCCIIIWKLTEWSNTICIAKKILQNMPFFHRINLPPRPKSDVPTQKFTRTATEKR